MLLRYWQSCAMLPRHWQSCVTLWTYRQCCTICATLQCQQWPKDINSLQGYWRASPLTVSITPHTTVIDRIFFSPMISRHFQCQKELLGKAGQFICFFLQLIDVPIGQSPLHIIQIFKMGSTFFITIQIPLSLWSQQWQSCPATNLVFSITLLESFFYCLMHCHNGSAYLPSNHLPGRRGVPTTTRIQPCWSTMNTAIHNKMMGAINSSSGRWLTQTIKLINKLS